jgi:hypothetical protein
MEEAMLARQRTTAPVSMRALIARINRKLADKGEVLKAARSERAASSVGLFFIVRGNRIASEQVDPEVLARKLGVLSTWEHLE